MNVLTRMIGAARLDPHTYEEVEADSSAMPQALLLVVVISILSGLGEYFRGDGAILDALVYAAVRGVVFWAVWALMIYMIGGTILRSAETHANWGQVARGTAFAQSPGVLNVLAFIPTVGGIITFVVFFWQFIGVIISARQTLDYTSSLRAFFVVLLAIIPSAIVYAIFAVTFGVFTASSNGS
ncbi:MAG: hypothetical protein OXT51_02400 [Chloroflexota bacterium]|nr:hypothetical protein [Chloroflexota bacterium]